MQSKPDSFAPVLIYMTKQSILAAPQGSDMTLSKPWASRCRDRFAKLGWMRTPCRCQVNTEGAVRFSCGTQTKNLLAMKAELTGGPALAPT